MTFSEVENPADLPEKSIVLFKNTLKPFQKQRKQTFIYHLLPYTIQ